MLGSRWRDFIFTWPLQVSWHRNIDRAGVALSTIQLPSAHRIDVKIAKKTRNDTMPGCYSWTRSKPHCYFRPKFRRDCRYENSRRPRAGQSSPDP